MGRPAKFTAEQVAKALTNAKGNMALAGRVLGCSASTVLNYAERYECCKSAVSDGRELRLDIAEAKLDVAVANGEGWAIMFTLKTLGKSRGYCERTEVSGPNGGPQVHKVGTVVDFRGRTIEELEEIIERAGYSHPRQRLTDAEPRTVEVGTAP